MRLVIRVSPTKVREALALDRSQAVVPSSGHSVLGCQETQLYGMIKNNPVTTAASVMAA